MPKKPKSQKESGTIKTKTLSPQQELFCQYFTNGDEDTFGNGTRSYLRAYNLDGEKKSNYESSKSSAHDLLTRPYILKRIEKLMDVVFNNEIADQQLAWIAMQKSDLPAAIAAIREWNKVKGRITNKLQVKGTFSLTELLDAVDNEDKDL